MAAVFGLFDGPVAVMLAKASDTIQGPAAMPGGTVWESKLDGFRGCIQARMDGRMTLWSRNGTDLSSSFPDLMAAAATLVPPGVVLDGEIVSFVNGRMSFDHLQHRMVSTAAAAARLARQHPASYVAFDILAVAGTDVRNLAWRDRRALLDELAAGFTPPLEVIPFTEDYDTALEWFTALADAGAEGIVSKGRSSPYRPGQRNWIKTKIRTSQDAVVGAVIGPTARPEAIVAGRFRADGILVIVGRSTPISAQQAADLAGVLIAVDEESHPWPHQIGGGHFGGGPVVITHVRPEIVVEVAADTALQAGRHRHPLRLLRLRPDLVAEDITDE